jgi:hypothetical protein
MRNIPVDILEVHAREDLYASHRILCLFLSGPGMDFWNYQMSAAAPPSCHPFLSTDRPLSTVFTRPPLSFQPPGKSVRLRDDTTNRPCLANPLLLLFFLTLVASTFYTLYCLGRNYYQAQKIGIYLCSSCPSTQETHYG